MLSIKTYPIITPQQIADEWQSLEQKCESVECFLSWPWISSWLLLHAKTAQLFKVYDKQTLIALAIICESNSQNIKAGFGRRAYFHKTGVPHLDEIWIEYNQALALPGYESSAHQAIINYLFNQTKVNQVELGVSDSDKISGIKSVLKKLTWQQPSYAIELKNWPCFPDTEKLPKYLSKNFKKQLKRTIKGFSALGELQLNIASSPSEKQAYFCALGKLHQTKWKHPDKGFNNSEFVKFHQQLILNHPNFCQLMKVDAGDINLGYLYFFTYRKKAYFYMSGLQSFTDNKLKAGISCHYLAICYFAKQAFTRYDFMAGHARYKASFSDRVIRMQSMRFFKNNIPNQLLLIAYKIKHIIFDTKD